MALRIRRIKKPLGIDEKVEKYVVVPDRATVVAFEHLCDQIAETSGINKGTVSATLYGLVNSMKTFIRQGHAVRIDGFGTFIPSFSAKSSLVETEANINSIYKIRLNFRPCVELREIINNMDFEFDVVDSTNDTKAANDSDGTDEPDGEGGEVAPTP